MGQQPKTETPAGSKQRPAERPDHPRDEALVDETVDDSFPASDPPAWTSETGSGKPAGSGEKGGPSGG